MSCPFLAHHKLSIGQGYGPTLLKMYGKYCPVISCLLENNASFQKQIKYKVKESNKSTCPFLPTIKGLVKEVGGQDVIEVRAMTGSSAFSYEDFFKEQIQLKKQQYLYRTFKNINRLGCPGLFPKAVASSSAKDMVTVWCSNDYLGMSCHPKVKAAVRETVDKFGAGSGGTRNISGNSTLHEELEQKLARLHQKEAALLFSSCFVANDSTIQTLCKKLPGCHVFSDIGNHASIIQGIKNSGVPKHIFRHNDSSHLEVLLKSVESDVPKIVVFESVHSMIGDVCPLEELCKVAHCFGALTFVDEVHSVGLYGENGAGIGERDRQLENMDIISGTLGKAFGNFGGYIASTAALVDLIRSYASGFIFTTSLPPPLVAGSLKAVEILTSDEGRELRKRLQANVNYMKASLLQHGFPIQNTTSHIISIMVGDPLKCNTISDTLLKEKLQYIQGINYPTVPKGQEMLRLAPTPFHTVDLMDTLVNDLKKVWVELHLPFSGCTRKKDGKQHPLTL